MDSIDRNPRVHSGSIRPNKQANTESLIPAEHQTLLPAQSNSSAIVSSPERALSPKELYQTATDVAGLCKDVVLKTSMKISGKNYIKVEGWQTIGAAHGCLAEIESVEETDIEGVHGLIAWAKLVRINDQAVLSRAAAFLGDDEDQRGISGKKYARFAKCQTRAISRVLSNAFRFVVVMMNAGLETTPAEEMPRESELEGDTRPQRQKEVANVNEPSGQKIIGLVSEAGDKPAQNKDGKATGETLFFAKVGGQGVWTKDRGIGEELLDVNGLEVVAHVVNSGKSFRVTEIKIPDNPKRAGDLELEPDDLDWGDKKPQPQAGNEADPF